MKKVTLEDIKNHFSYCIDEGLTIGEYEETLLFSLYKKVERYEKAKTLKPIEEWDEDYGDCLWWSLPIEEPPYCGTPLDSDFPDYVTHFTRLISPIE